MSYSYSKSNSLPVKFPLEAFGVELELEGYQKGFTTYAQKFGYDLEAIRSAKLYLAKVLADACAGTNTRGRLFTTIALCHRFLFFAKKHYGGERLESNGVIHAWEEGICVIPFPVTGYIRKGKLTERGTVHQGGFVGYLECSKYFEKRVVTDRHGVEHVIPGATARKPTISNVIIPEIFAKTGIADFYRNGKGITSSISLTNLPLLLLLAEVAEEMIEDLYCFEAVPDWSASLRHDYNYFFGENTYKRNPFRDDPRYTRSNWIDHFTINPEDYYSFDATDNAIEEFCKENIPNIATRIYGFIMSGVEAAKSVVQRCSKRVIQVNDGIAEAYVRVGGELLQYAEGSLECIEMMKNFSTNVILRLIREDDIKECFDPREKPILRTA